MKHSESLKTQFGSDFLLVHAIGDILDNGHDSRVVKTYSNGKEPVALVGDLRNELKGMFNTTVQMIKRVDWKTVVEIGLPPQEIETAFLLVKNALDTSDSLSVTETDDIASYLKAIWFYAKRLLTKQGLPTPTAIKAIQQEVVSVYDNGSKNFSAETFKEMSIIITQGFFGFLDALNEKILDTIQHMSKTFVLILEALSIQEDSSEAYRFSMKTGWFFYISMTNLFNVMPQDDIFVVQYIRDLSIGFADKVEAMKSVMKSLTNSDLKKTTVFEVAKDVVSSDMKWNSRHFGWISGTIKVFFSSSHTWFRDFFPFISPLMASWFGESIHTAFKTVEKETENKIFLDITEGQDILESMSLSKKLPLERKQEIKKTLDVSNKVLNNMIEAGDLSMRENAKHMSGIEMASEFISSLFLNDDIDFNMFDYIFKSQTGYGMHEYMELQQGTNVALALQMVLATQTEFLTLIGGREWDKSTKGKEEEEEEEVLMKEVYDPFDRELDDFEKEEIKKDMEIVKSGKIVRIENRIKEIEMQITRAKVIQSELEKNDNFNILQDVNVAHDKSESRAKLLKYSEGYSDDIVMKMTLDRRLKFLSTIIRTSRGTQDHVLSAVAVDYYEARKRFLVGGLDDYKFWQTTRRSFVFVILLILFGGALYLLVTKAFPENAISDFFGFNSSNIPLKDEQVKKIVNTVSLGSEEVAKKTISWGRAEVLRTAGGKLVGGGKFVGNWALSFFKTAAKDAAKEGGLLMPTRADAYSWKRFIGAEGILPTPQYEMQLWRLRVQDAVLGRLALRVTFQGLWFLSSEVDNIWQRNRRNIRDVDRVRNKWREFKTLSTQQLYFAVKFYQGAQIAMQTARWKMLKNTMGVVRELVSTVAGGGAFKAIGMGVGLFTKPASQTTSQTTNPFEEELAEISSDPDLKQKTNTLQIEIVDRSRSFQTTTSSSQTKGGGQQIHIIEDNKGQAKPFRKPRRRHK